MDGCSGNMRPQKKYRRSNIGLIWWKLGIASVLLNPILNPQPIIFLTGEDSMENYDSQSLSKNIISLLRQCARLEGKQRWDPALDLRKNIPRVINNLNKSLSALIHLHTAQSSSWGTSTAYQSPDFGSRFRTTIKAHFHVHISFALLYFPLRSENGRSIVVVPAALYLGNAKWGCRALRG
jgi:hypothetical protein